MRELGVLLLHLLRYFEAEVHTSSQDFLGEVFLWDLLRVHLQLHIRELVVLKVELCALRAARQGVLLFRGSLGDEGHLSTLQLVELLTARLVEEREFSRLLVGFRRRLIEIAVVWTLLGRYRHLAVRLQTAFSLIVRGILQPLLLGGLGWSHSELEVVLLSS
uniref:Secreted protein n=1 Tax=Strombidium inclinatum TaxID=197538 RepID=A0A7S3IH72_9SPIT